MRKTSFGELEYYRVYSRGNDKQILFRNKQEYARFLFLLLHGQSSVPIHNTKRMAERLVNKGTLGMREAKVHELFKKREVELVVFALMPNHFHAVVREVVEGGVSGYMHRVLTGYAMYFNTRYERSGHVFQGPFGATHISNNNQLLYTSAYIHLNPSELRQYRRREITYPWSSYVDYVKENRWGTLLEQEIITSQFDTSLKYRNFVETSGAKSEFREFCTELDDLLL